MTIEYDNYSQKNIPVAPTVSRIRYDLHWSDVEEDYKKELKNSGNFLFSPFLTFLFSFFFQL